MITTTVQGPRRTKSTSEPDTFEKYRDTPPMSIATLSQKYALLLAESSIYSVSRDASHLHRDNFAEVLVRNGQSTVGRT